jgi:hypothetical protein
LEAGNIRMTSVYVCKDNDEMRENYCYVKILMQETQVLKIIAQRRYDVNNNRYENLRIESNTRAMNVINGSFTRHNGTPNAVE